MGMYGMERKAAERRGLRILFKKSRTQEHGAYSNRRVADIVLCIYLICIVGYLVLTLNVSELSIRENRKLETFPTIFNENGINKNFSAAAEKYISDHLSARNEMIDGYFTVLSLFDRRGNKQVFIGKDGWLFGNFVGNTHNFEMLSYYQRKVYFTTAQLKKIKADLKRLNDWAAARGIKLYVYFPPDKQTIYKEYYPRFVNTSDEPTLVTEVEEFLKGEINVVSLEGAFLKHRHHDLLHYKTESHWSPAGAYLAYRLIMRRLGRDFPLLNRSANGISASANRPMSSVRCNWTVIGACIKATCITCWASRPISIHMNRCIKNIRLKTKRKSKPTLCRRLKQVSTRTVKR